jgi:phosphoribosylanthranilate isomerase
MRVKICGIRTIEDARLAISCGADAIGLLVGQKHRSDDFISVELAQEIGKICPPYVSPVLVTHLEKATEIYQLASRIGVNTIQIHSECQLQEIKTLRQMLPFYKLVKNFHVTSNNLNDFIHPFESLVDAFILDTINLEEDRVGGTGITHDWNISAKIVQQISIPVILAGGLNPKNVADAIKFVKPYAVDVNTGVKNSEGFKDFKKVADFVRNSKIEFFRVSGLI